MGVASALVFAIACSKSVDVDQQNTSTNVGALCASDNECKDAVCVYALCRPTCVRDTDCGGQGVCLSDTQGRKGCRLPAEDNCSAAPCPSGLVCATDQSCRSPCSIDPDCKVQGQRCDRGACAAASASVDGGGGDEASTKPDASGATDSGTDGSTDPTCGRLGQPCCGGPGPACGIGGACAGAVCSCFADIIKNGSLRTATGKLVALDFNGDVIANRTLTDSSAQPFLAKGYMAAYTADADWAGIALRDDSTVWGFGTYSGTTTAGETKQIVPGRVVDFDANNLGASTRLGRGAFGGSTRSRGVIVGGVVYRWGQYNAGGNALFERATPLVADAGGAVLQGVVDYESDEYQGFALLTNGTLMAHGYNSLGQLGIGAADAVRHFYPEAVQGLGGQVVVKAVIGGTGNSCALLGSKEVVCWGSNDYGSLGIGTSGGIGGAPNLHVMTGAGTPLANIVEVLSIGGPTCAIRGTDGSVWCWGYQASRTGDGNAAYATQMLKVDGALLTGITKLAPSLMMDDKGRLWKNPGKVGVPEAALLTKQPVCP